MLNAFTKDITAEPAVRPQFLPFKSCADILAFNAATDEEFDDVVRIIILIQRTFFLVSNEQIFQVKYLKHLGGVTAKDATAKHLKNCLIVNEDIFRNVNWVGVKTDDNRVALKDSRFAEASERKYIIAYVLL